MEIYIWEEIRNFSYSVILGLIFGGIYDIIKIIQLSCGIVSFFGKDRGMKRGFGPFLIFAALDLAFFLVITVSFSVFLYAVNNGGFRWYLLFGVVLGMVIYHHTAGKIVMFFSETIIRFIRMTVHLLLIKPVLFAARVIGAIFSRLWNHTAMILIRAVQMRAATAYTERVMKRIHKDMIFQSTERKGMAQNEKTK